MISSKKIMMTRTVPGKYIHSLHLSKDNSVFFIDTVKEKTESVADQRQCQQMKR